MSRKLGLGLSVSLAAALLMGGCAGGGSTSFGPNPATSVSPVGTAPFASVSAVSPKAQPTRSLAAVHSWAMPPLAPDPKTGAMLAALTSRSEQLLIIDPAVIPGSAGPDGKAKPLAALQQNGRRVLALLDISEIQSGSARWNPAWTDAQGKPTAEAPEWLGEAVSQRPTVYSVNYWDPKWQKLILDSLDKIVAAGYDGVCLEGTGAFQGRLAARSAAGTEMAEFVDDLATHARKTVPNFSALPDGGADLPAALTDAQKKDYLAAVDGILARDLFYPGDKPADNDLAPQANLLAALDAFQKSDKPVFVTERLTDPDKITDFVARAKSKGYLPDAAFVASPSPTQTTPAPSAAPSPMVASVKSQP